MSEQVQTVTEQNTIAFQVNELLNVQELGHKPTNEEIDLVNRRIYWKYFERTVTDLIDQFIAKGETYRYGIKQETNRQDSFEFACGCALDIDAETKEQLEAALENPLILSSCLAYTSPSYNPDIGKFGIRINFTYSRKIDDLKLNKKIILTLLCIFQPTLLEKLAKLGDGDVVEKETKVDPSTFDPCRLWFGMKEDSIILHRFDTAVLDVDSIIENIPEIIHQHIDKIAQYELNLESNELSKNQQFAIYLQETIGDPSVIVQKLVEAYQKDNPHLIFANCGVHDSPGDAIAEWRMFDVILGSDSGTGKSFAVSIKPDNTIVFRSGKTGVSGDIPTLAYYLKAGSWDVAVMNTKTMPHKWYEMVKEVCDRLEIPEYRFSDDFDSTDERFIKVGEVIANRYLVTRRGNLLRYIDRKAGKSTSFYEYVNYQLLLTEQSWIKVLAKQYIIKKIMQEEVEPQAARTLRDTVSRSVLEPINAEIEQTLESNENTKNMMDRIQELTNELFSLDLNKRQLADVDHLAEQRSTVSRSVTESKTVKQNSLENITINIEE